MLLPLGVHIDTLYPLPSGSGMWKFTEESLLGDEKGRAKSATK
jgi:hypothetical protein